MLMILPLMNLVLRRLLFGFWIEGKFAFDFRKASLLLCFEGLCWFASYAGLDTGLLVLLAGYKLCRQAVGL